MLLCFRWLTGGNECSLGRTLAAERDQTKLWKNEMEEGGGRPRLKSLWERKRGQGMEECLKWADGSPWFWKQLDGANWVSAKNRSSRRTETYIMLSLVYGLAWPRLQNLLKHIWVPKFKPLPHGEWIIRQEFICWISCDKKSLHLSTWHTADQ